MTLKCTSVSCWERAVCAWADALLGSDSAGFNDGCAQIAPLTASFRVPKIPYRLWATAIAHARQQTASAGQLNESLYRFQATDTNGIRFIYPLLTSSCLTTTAVAPCGDWLDGEFAAYRYIFAHTDLQ